MNGDYSKNARAEKIVGRRNAGIAINTPAEMGYTCPACQYEATPDDWFDERLEWSEYNGFIWCRVCNKDYPSALYLSDTTIATNIYLDAVEAAIDEKIAQLYLENIISIGKYAKLMNVSLYEARARLKKRAGFVPSKQL